MRRVPATVAGAMVAGVLLSACGDGSSADSDEPGDVSSINEALLSALTMERQISDVTNRLVIDCMADAGFDVHPPDLTYDSTAELEAESYQPPLSGSDPLGMAEFPTVDEAREHGIGFSEKFAPDYDWEAEGGGPNPHSDDPFYEMSDEYVASYEKARYGETTESGEDTETGCGDQVHAELTTVTGHQMGVPSAPEGVYDWEAQLNLYETEALYDAQDDWSACMEERGYPYFEFQTGTADLRSYVATFHEWYDPDTFDSVITYEPPPGAPWGQDEALAREIDFAVDVAECADETGIRDTMRSEWDAAMASISLEYSDIIFAWYDEMEIALEAAQTLLTA